VWASSKLEKACSDDRQGGKHFGADNWKLLRRRLAALYGAPTLADMEGTPGNCHQLRGDRSGQFAISLSGPWRLVFEPAHDPLPLLADGVVDAARVTSIEIKEVVNYHGK
jgi:proteic killer suppression protein